jgi:type I restriction enzyme S subunit
MHAGLVDHHASGGKPIPAENLVGYKVTSPGEIVMNRMRASAGLFGTTRISGLVSPDYAVLRPREPVELDYFVQLFRTPAMRAVFRLESRGLGTGESGFMRLYTDRFGMLSAPIPSTNEQAAIVRFIAHLDRHIAEYARAKRTLISRLDEQLLVMVASGVLRGVHDGVELTHTGVPWLGDVPKHWEVLPLRRVMTARCDGPFGSGLTSAHYTEAGVRVVRLQNIGFAEFVNTDAAFISAEHYATLGDHDVEPGDVLIAGLGDEKRPAGRACVAPADVEPAMVKADCFRFRPDRTRIDAEFAAFHLTATARTAAGLLSTGATRQRVNLRSMSNRTIACPPLAEQLAIVSWLKNVTRPIVSARASAEHQLLLIRELRERVVSDVVTGQLDVRGASSRLPDLRGELDSVEELEAAEGDEFGAEDLEGVPA